MSHLCQETKAAVPERVGNFPAGLGSRKKEVRQCRGTILVSSQPRNSSYIGLGLNMNETGLNQELPETPSILDLIKY